MMLATLRKGSFVFLPRADDVVWNGYDILHAVRLGDILHQELASVFGDAVRIDGSGWLVFAEGRLSFSIASHAGAVDEALHALARRRRQQSRRILIDVPGDYRR